MTETTPTTNETPENTEPRRGFLKKTIAIAAGAVAFLVPYTTGMLFFLNPLFKKKNGSAEGNFLRVTTLEAIPNDGTPQRFAITADKKDGWNTFLNQPLGSVYLSKKKNGDILALNTKCPHAGCSVHASENGFVCPCHNALFSSDGSTQNTVSPRSLDELVVEVRNKNEVWIDFKNFRTTTAQKIPTA